jgi:N-acetylmuramoyl-L-alanine amidase
MLSVDRNTVVIGVKPRISPTTFEAVLKAANSPAAGDSDAIYAAIVGEGADPAFALAFFKHESQFGQFGVCHDYETKSIGNTRTSRIGVKTFVMVQGKGQYVKYPDWQTGARDAIYRLTDPDFDYAKACAKTIGQILPIWAPKSDSNSPEAYINSVVASMNSWISNEGDSGMAQKPNITWVGSPNRWSDRSGRNVIAICNHIMQGSLESTDGWFNNPASQVSAHFGVGKDGRIHQYVSLDGAAWANGVAEHIDNTIPWLVGAVGNGINENNLTVSIEHEGNTGDPMPEPQYQATLALHKWLLSLYPAIKVDRQHIIGHYQISGTIKVNCPGKGFPWSRLMADLAQGSSPALPDGFILDTSGHNAPGTLIDTSTGFLINQPFADYWLNNGGLEKFGRPVEYGLHGEAGSPGAVVKEFQYAKMYISGGKVVAEIKDRNNPKGFDVGAGILAKAKELGLTMLTNGQFFLPAANQPGLGKMERAWAQDAKGVTVLIMASELIELAKPGQDTPWKVEVYELL